MGWFEGKLGIYGVLLYASLNNLPSRVGWGLAAQKDQPRHFRRMGKDVGEGRKLRRVEFFYGHGSKVRECVDGSIESYKASTR